MKKLRMIIQKFLIINILAYKNLINKKKLVQNLVKY